MRDRQPVLVETAEQFVDDPVGGLLAVAPGGDVFEIGGIGDIGRQHARVIFGHAVFGDEARLLFVGQLGQAVADRIHPVLFQRQRQQVGAGEIAIVMGLFLGAHGARLALVGVEQAGFLHHLAAIFQNGDLAARLVFDCLLDETHRVHVLDLAARAQMGEILAFHVAFVIARAADRHVHVGAQVAVLHVAVAGAQIPQDLAQLDDIGRGLFGAADIGTRDDLHQGNAGAVEIDKAHVRVHVVDRLAGILFQMDAFDAHAPRGALAHLDQNLAFAHDGVV